MLIVNGSPGNDSRSWWASIVGSERGDDGEDDEVFGCTDNDAGR